MGENLKDQPTDDYRSLFENAVEGIFQIREEEIFQAMARHLGVRYVYEESYSSSNCDPKVEAIMTREAFLAISAPLVSNLAQAIEIADLDLMETILEQIKKENPDLAKGITICLDNFQYDKLLNFIR